MNNLSNFKTETNVGILEFIGIPVLNDFNYKSFALDNGFIYTITDSIDNTDKFGGVGFFVAKNHSVDSEMSYTDKKILEVLFINRLPVMYRIV